MKHLGAAFLFLFSSLVTADPGDYSKGTCVVTDYVIGTPHLEPTNHSFDDCRTVGWWLMAPYEVTNISSIDRPQLSQELVQKLVATISVLLLLGYMFRLVRRVMNL